MKSDLEKTGEERMQQQLCWFLVMLVFDLVMCAAIFAGIVWLVNHLQWK